MQSSIPTPRRRWKLLATMFVLTLPLISAGGVQRSLSEVSLVHLIVSPEQFRGKRVSVRGYVGTTPIGLFLFLSVEARATTNWAESIRVLTHDSKAKADVLCGEGYVSLVGTFGEVEGLILGLHSIESAGLWDLESGRAEDCRLK